MAPKSAEEEVGGGADGRIHEGFPGTGDYSGGRDKDTDRRRVVRAEPDDEGCIIEERPEKYEDRISSYFSVS